MGFEVGDAVLVSSVVGKTEHQRRAVVSWVDEETADVVYEKLIYIPDVSSTISVEEEESKINFERIILQHSIEVDESKFDNDAEKCKALGGRYFQSKNFSAAYNEYLKSLKLIQSGPVLALLGMAKSKEEENNIINSIVGATVLVQMKRNSGPTNKFASATIAMTSADDKSADVMFEEDEGEEDEVHAKRIILVSGDQSLGQLQCNLYLNLARCCSKLKDNASAVWYATIAIALGNYFVALKKDKKHSANGVESKTDMSVLTISRDTWVKAFYLRAKCHLAMRHFKQARIDGNKVLKLDKHNRDAQKLLDSIKPLEERQFRKDKKLVKEVCKMVDDAMNSSPSKKK